MKSLLRKYERFRVSYIYLKFDLKCFSQALARKIVCKSQLIVIFTIYHVVFYASITIGLTFELP